MKSKKRSLTIIGLAVVVLSFIFEKLGLQIGEEELRTTIATIVKVFGFVMVYVGRYRQNDIDLLGKKED